MVTNTQVWTAIVTPMQADGAVDYQSLQNLLKAQADAGCGVVLLGSTGEGIALDQSEQRELVRFVIKLDFNFPLLVGVGGFRLAEQLQWLEYCNQFSRIDGYLMVTPLYAKPGAKGQSAWFKALLDKANKPCMLYNVPSRTGVNLHYDVIKNLSSHPNLWALKEASGDIERFKQYQKTMPNLAIFSGEDGLMPQLGRLGARGLVSVVANIWPSEALLYVQKSLDGDIDTHTNNTWQLATSACFCASNPIPAKVWLHHKGVIASNTLRLPLDASDLRDITLLQQADNEVQQWFHMNKEGVSA
ncbi:4-hydroxy-tetrahydrodipicolinate synthase [Facilibium subflavum]|uniref:4-hydroxy-tetrahydrodipicolinate synthase n=1 Tax=Facilibium subflavum TaxID=2219058 RepID=UPI000E655CF8|nr:4-hydroxy-tetrahydrodipicolinate synthase [Facilibium subflavum]